MSRNPSPVVAAALSLVFPGLGQIYAGATRRGVIWALPTIALVLLAAIVIVGKIPLTGLVTAEATLAVIALEFAFLFYHLAAMLDAYGIAQRERKSAGFATAGSATAGLIALIILAVLFHGYPLYVSVIGNNALAALFPDRHDVVPSASFSQEPIESIPVEVTDSPAPTTPGAEPTPTPTAGSTATPGGTPTTPPASFPPLDNPYGDRLNLLLIGSDAGPGRHGGRTDTMIVLSIDIPTGKAAMFGFPRNMTSVPIEDANGNGNFNRMWSDPFPPGNGNPAASLLTNMWQYAYDNESQFYTPTESCQETDPNLQAQCLGDARAFRATTGAIQNLAGVPIHGVVAVNLEAFRSLVDAVGGVWMDIPEPIYDEAYPAGDDVSPHVINIPAGCHWLDGIYALAYARSRHQDSDYQRMRRQQSVLTAVRKQFDPLAMLPRLDELLNVASNNLWTTIDRNDIPLLAQIASRVNADRIYNVRITPGQGYPSNLTDAEIKSIRSRVQHIFEQPQPAPDPTPNNPSGKCPQPGQTPGETYSTKPK